MAIFTKRTRYLYHEMKANPRDASFHQKFGEAVLRITKNNRRLLRIALHHLQTALDLDNPNARTMMLMGRAYEMNGAWERSLQLYACAMFWNPRLKYLTRDINRVDKLDIRDTKQRIKYLKLQLKIMPESSVIHKQIAKDYYRLGKNRMELIHYKKACKYDPNDEYPCSMIFFHYWFHVKDLKKALPWGLRAAAVSKNDEERSFAYEKLSEFYALVKLYDEAIEYTLKEYNLAKPVTEKWKLLTQVADLYSLKGDSANAALYLALAQKEDGYTDDEEEFSFDEEDE